MNLDDGQYASTNVWTPYFKYLRNRQNGASNDNITTPPAGDDIALSSNG